MKKILVVDDSATSRAILRACLPKSFEYELREAHDEGSCLKQISDFPPDLCFMDYNMPEKTGTEIAQSMIDDGTVTKFVLMTANMQESVVERAKGLGFIAFIEKPVTPDKISKLLEDLADEIK